MGRAEGGIKASSIAPDFKLRHYPAAAQTLPALPWTFIPSRVASMLAGAAVTTRIHVALSQHQDWSTASRLGFALSPCSLGRCVCWSALALAKALRFKPENFTLSNCVLQFDVGTGRAQAAANGDFVQNGPDGRALVERAAVSALPEATNYRL